MFNTLVPVGIKKLQTTSRSRSKELDKLWYIHMTESQLLDDRPHIEDLGPIQIDKKHTMQPLQTMSQKH